MTEPLQDIGRLLISCPDRPGIVAAISQFLLSQGGNIIHSDQHATEQVGGTFFMRVEFQLPHLIDRGEELERAFHAVADRFDMQWYMAYASRIKRLAVFVSKEEHALYELLWRCKMGDLPAEISMIISNHPNVETTVASWGIPFHYIPVEPDQKQEAEARQLQLMEGKIDAVVFARYMQIVTPKFVSRYPNRIINIHHSFLPAFVGAEPYTRAYERGVKIIGATAHYVTADLDGGPIIEQDVQRVNHRPNVKELKRVGQYVERVVLARAVTWHVEDRILVHGNKTVVFY